MTWMAGSSPAVTMKDIKFNPSTVNIKAGDTVTWTNDDSVAHDVTGDGFKSGSAGNIQGGVYSTEMVFDEVEDRRRDAMFRLLSHTIFSGKSGSQGRPRKEAARHRRGTVTEPQ